MYEETEKRSNINWISLILKLVLLVVLVFVLFFIFKGLGSNTTLGSSTSSEYTENITKMKDTAKEYFTISSNLPTKIGDIKKLTLDEMVNQKLLIDFTNEGKSCDLNDSYIQATKMSDNNYALKVKLVCGKTSDFIVTTIEKESVKASSSTAVEETNNNTTNSSNNAASNNTSTNNTTTNSNTNTVTKTDTVVTKKQVTLTYSIACESCVKTEQTKWYKYVSEWEEGYLTGKNVETKYVSEDYYDYCQDQEKGYYTTGWIGSTADAQTYTYTLKLNDIVNAKEGTVGVSSSNYFSSSYDDYNTYIDTRDQYIEMVGSNYEYNIYGFTVSQFYNSSLKKNNFTFKVSGAYKNGDYYYVDITVNYKNGNNVTAYYYDKVNDNVYFVPLKFTVNFADQATCKEDKAEYLQTYLNGGWSVCNPHTVNKYYHRMYVWSTKESLEGYTYTGESVYSDTNPDKY